MNTPALRKQILQRSAPTAAPTAARVIAAAISRNPPQKSFSASRQYKPAEPPTQLGAAAGTSQAAKIMRKT